MNKKLKLLKIKHNIEFNLRQIFIVPFGKLRKPMKLKYSPMCGLMDEIYDIPVCPKCKEYAYKKTSCVFCGQRFL